MMDKVKRIEASQRDNDLLYNESYYQNYNGDDYGRNEKWLGFFGNIADNIICKIRPRTMLDIGCAYGLLVESLRDRGCEAYGIDVSDYAISRARADIIPYLSVDTILRPMEKKYDLIVTIEVIEHIKEEDCDSAVKNMCSAADRILLATTPDDFDDPTHFNVQPPIYWVEKFSKFGFVPDIMHDAGYLTPYAILFVRSASPLDEGISELFGEKKLQDYYFSKVNHERNILKVEKPILEAKIKTLGEQRSKQEQAITDGAQHVENLNQIISTESAAREHLQTLFDKRSSSLSWRVTKPIRVVEKIIDICRPIKPRFLDGNNGQAVLCPQVSDDINWISIRVSADKPEQCELSLLAAFTKQIIRLPLLKLPSSNNTVAWLARLENSPSKITINILRGEPKELKIYQIASTQAWIKIALDRWRRGKGIKAAIGLALRTGRVAINEGLGKALSTLWPSYATEVESYDHWLLAYDSQTCHNNVDAHLRALKHKPRISIVLPTYNSDLDFLKKAIASVKYQSYKNWQLCIADDGSTSTEVLRFLKDLVAEDSIEINFRQVNGHIAKATNSALELVDGDFVTFLDHDDILHPHALATTVSYLNKDPNLDILYSDEDKVDEHGNRSQPFFKSGWNPDLILSQNYICHLVVIRKTVIDKLGGIKEGTEGAQDYDLILRATEITDRIQHIPHVLYHWRAVVGSTALGINEKNYAHQKSSQVLADALERRNIKGKVEQTGINAYHRVLYDLPVPTPKVSVIIPTKDHVDLLSNCIDGLLNKTAYNNFEIVIIDNNSVETATHAYFEKIRKNEKIKIIEFPGPFNFSAINNLAVSKTDGEVIVLLNNDVEVIHSDWLRELVSQAVRPSIGTVGCRLYYPDDHVQHDGIIAGIGGVAGYAHPRLERFKSGEFGRSKVVQNYSAVTAAALAVKRSIYEEVHGLDDEHLTVAFNDVDFCLRVQEAGYKNLYTPFAELYHHESVSRGPDTDPRKAARFEKEALFMKARWKNIIEDDPFYNPNLSLHEGYKLDLERGKLWPWQESSRPKGTNK